MVKINKFIENQVVVFLIRKSPRKKDKLEAYDVILLEDEKNILSTKDVISNIDSKYDIKSLPEVNASTNTPPDVITPLHPVLPVDTVEIPTVKTVMKHFPMATPFPHTATTMITALSLQNQLQKLTES